MFFSGNGSRSPSCLRSSSAESELHIWEKWTLCFLQNRAEVYYFQYYLSLVSSCFSASVLLQRYFALLSFSVPSVTTFYPLACFFLITSQFYTFVQSLEILWQFPPFPNQTLLSSKDCSDFWAWENWDWSRRDRKVCRAKWKEFPVSTLSTARSILHYILYPFPSESWRKLSISKHETPRIRL